MKILITIASILATPLAAQGPTLTLVTATDYGVAANNGVTRPVVDGSPVRTVIVRGLSHTADAQEARAHVNVARASTGLGVTVEEAGSVASRSATAPLLATTVDSTTLVQPAPHTLALLVQGTTATDGVVTVTWSGQVGGTAAISCAVDLDGDSRPEFTGAATGRPVTQQFRVSRSGRDFLFALTTAGRADLRGAGAASYAGSLTVLFQEGGGGGGGGCALTPYGPECRGHLEGTATASGRSIDVALRLTGSAPNAIGLLFLGASEANISLGRCSLLVDPAHVQLFATDAQGAAVQRFQFPGGQAVRAFLQDVVLDLSGPQLQISSSNGLRLECRG